MDPCRYGRWWCARCDHCSAGADDLHAGGRGLVQRLWRHVVVACCPGSGSLSSGAGCHRDRGRGLDCDLRVCGFDHLYRFDRGDGQAPGLAVDSAMDAEQGAPCGEHCLGCGVVDRCGRDDPQRWKRPVAAGCGLRAPWSGRHPADRRSRYACGDLPSE